MANQIKPEIWKIIKDSLSYAVSNYGRVMRILPGQGTQVKRILKPRLRGRYLHVKLCSPKCKIFKFVQHLVLEAFISPRPKGKQCNHKDGNKLNNFVDNLEWVTPSQNRQHSVDVLGNGCGETHGMAKLTKENVLQIRDVYRTGNYTCRQLARIHNVSFSNISQIINHITWKHI